MNVTSFLHRRWMALQSIVLRTAPRVVARSVPRFDRTLLPLRIVATAACVSGVAACSGGDIVQLPPGQDADRVWFIQLDVKALALAKDSTYQVSATAFNAKREPMTGLPPIRFRSLNTGRVSVNETGLITGNSPTSSASVVAELTINGATYADTVAVYVTETAHDARSIVFRKWDLSPISTQLDVRSTVSFNTELLDDMGVAIAGVTPSVSSSNPVMLSGNATYAFGIQTGKAKLRASIVAYGRRVSDSVEITVVIPSNVNNPLFAPPSGTQLVATGGSITWTSFSFDNKIYNITFDQNSPAIVGGNVDQLLPYASATRTFTAPGTYAYRDTINKTSGIVLVRDQPTY